MSEDEEVNYSEYLKSERWKARRGMALSLANWKCARCGSRDRLDVHHLTYDRLGHERMSDLKVLCRSCHDDFHITERYSTAVETFAAKKHGDHWYDFMYFDEVAEEFDAWLERKQESY